MINFLHTFSPQPILFQFGSVQVHWYGLFIVLAIVTGILLVSALGKRYNIFFDDVVDLGFYLVIAGIVGARLYAVCLDLPYYATHPLEIAAVWRGGLAIHGAIIFGALTLLVYCYYKRQSVWRWLDLIAPALALGQAIGRWGNYFNQEIFGRPTLSPWGIPIDWQNRPAQFMSSQYFQPTFLYESLLNLLNCLILLILFWRKPKTPGVIAGVYLINYSLIRIAMEFWRTDDTPLFFGVRWPIVASVILIICGVVMIVRKSPILFKTMSGKIK